MNLLSLNRGYNYGMMNVIERRPFSELGDQQLLEQTRRLAANQRCLEVHILDHLDEIDRRGLALRRGFSSLFDYAVRELRFSDAAAQRRIQAMRLCRRHGWVRASLQSGALSMTAAGQLETTFAGAERAERQSHNGHRNGGQGRGHDQDHDCAGYDIVSTLPYVPSETGIALNLGKQKKWHTINLQHFQTWSKRIDVPWPAVKEHLLDALAAARDLWPGMLRDLPMHEPHKEVLRDHWTKLSADFRLI